MKETIQLCVRNETSWKSRPQEELAITSVEVEPDQSEMISLRVSNPQNLRLYDFYVELLIRDRRIGLVSIFEWMVMDPSRPWRWMLSRLDLAEIERLRQGNDLQITLRGYGVAQIRNESVETTRLVHVYCSTTITIPRSDWERQLVRLNYQPFASVTLPLERSHWPEWSQVTQKMEEAIKFLDRGETHAALEQCLGLLERIQSAPYREDSWGGFFDVDEQKDQALGKLIAGVATYLNKVGHHASRIERDEKGELLRSSVDQFEAEVMVAMTQLLVAYLSRLPRRTSA